MKKGLSAGIEAKAKITCKVDFVCAFVCALLLRDFCFFLYHVLTKLQETCRQEKEARNSNITDFFSVSSTGAYVENFIEKLMSKS